jgi:hypothetical protein
MQGVSTDGAMKFYWCPRCGTLRTRETWEQAPPDDDDAVPMLVERCRKYALNRLQTPQSLDYDEWCRLGIAESINVPAERT